MNIIFKQVLLFSNMLFEIYFFLSPWFCYIATVKYVCVCFFVFCFVVCFFYLLLIYSACSWPWSLKGIFIHSELFLYFFQDSECNFQIEIPVKMRLPSSSPQCRKPILCALVPTQIGETQFWVKQLLWFSRLSNCDLLSGMKNDPSSS